MKTLKKIWLVFTHDETKALPLAALGGTAGFIAMSIIFSSLVFVAISLLTAGLLVWAVRELMLQLDDAEEQGLRTLGEEWARSGETEEEVRQRYADLQDMGPSFAHGGLPSTKPMVNVDGTPMMGDIDIHGRVFGDVHSVGFNSVSDVGNNSFMDPSSSYHSPFGRD